MMNRRRFLQTASASLLAAPSVADAQPAGKVGRVGFLYFGSGKTGAGAGRYEAFLEGLRELGYIEGKTIVVEARFAESRAERIPGFVAELLRLKVDVIVAAGSPTYRALRQTAAAPPVVVTVTNDPILEGLAASLARPGGNFTGLADTAGDLTLKQLELLRTVLPKLSRVGVLTNPANTSHERQSRQLAPPAQALGIHVLFREAQTAAQIEPVFASLARDRAEAAVFFGDTFFSEQLRAIAGSALKHRLASIYITREYPDAGGLMSYGAPLVDNFRRAAAFVDKILKGASPAELPFEQPSRYVLAINMKAARALGLAIPPSLLARADQIIE
jgi:putative tryptophan/tyrosine transport system substrate-binding protein